MSDRPILVCLTCEWTTRTESDRTCADRTEAAIRHHGRTGHTIERIEIPETDDRRRQSTETGWATEWPPDPGP